MSWEKVRLGDVCTMNSGGTPSRRNLEFYTGEIPWAKISDIENAKSGVLKYTEEHITEEGLASINNRIFNEGTLLLAMYGSVGKVAFAGMRLATNQAILGINIQDENVLNYAYLKYWFQTIKEQLLSRAVGGTLQNISLGIVKELLIPLPPLATQKRIADILDTADALRRKDQELLAKYDQLAQAIFIDMFGDPMKNEKGWEKNKASNYIDVMTGYAFKSDKYSKNFNDIRLCGGLIIMPWGIEWENSNRWDIDSYPISEKYLLQINDIVMALDRPWILSGFKIAMIQNEDIPSLLVQRTARIRAKGINHDFLYSLFKHPEFERFTIPTETTVPHISPEDIRKYQLIVPPIELQNKYSKTIQLIEAQKRIIKLNLGHSDSLFQSLIQQAFKGELVA